MRHIRSRGCGGDYLFGGDDMMELEFRAFMKPSYLSDEDGMVYNIDPFECPYKKFPTMQYTGFKDKDKNKIYADDIVNFAFGDFSPSNPARITFEKGCWGLYWIGEKQACDEGFKALWNTESNEFDWNLSESKIIGDIHRNPELLKEQPCQ